MFSKPPQGLLGKATPEVMRGVTEPVIDGGSWSSARQGIKAMGHQPK